MLQCTLLQVTGIEKTDNTFRKELCAVAGRLGTHPDFLAATMSVESGFSPSIQNRISGATGLIQFMPDTAKSLGTTTKELAQMSATEQLAFVEKYFQPHIGKLNSPGDVYSAVFFPLAIGKPNGFVIGRSGDPSIIPGTKLSYGKVYKDNSSLDHNKDGEITKSDLGTVVGNVLAKAKSKPPIVVDGAEGPPPPILVAGTSKGPPVLLAFAGGLALGWWLLPKILTSKRSNR
jgi:hypothetical protein